jgi:AcrR family transcriptional regulator
MVSRTGRCTGKLDTRGEILAAARRQFARRGYAGATIRAIAAEADVDPALVHYYYSTKRDLFIASLDLPFDPDKLVEHALGGDPQHIGRQVARRLLELMESERGRTAMQALLRSALTDERVMRMLREFMLETVLGPIVHQLPADQPQLRATLFASQMIGLMIVRLIIGLEPLASADPDKVIAAMAPNLERYLTGDLDG